MELEAVRKEIGAAQEWLSELARSPNFVLFRERLLAANERVNLTRIVSEGDFAVKHIEDSLLPLFLSEYFNVGLFDSPRRVIDVGTGGGFPVFPMALMFSERRLCGRRGEHKFVGFDSVGKKMRALSEIAGELGINGLSFISGRAEELARLPEYRERFDVVTSRAVAELPVLLEYMAPFVAVGGFAAAYKSGGVRAEVETARVAAKELSLELIESVDYSLSGDSGERTLLVYRKTGRIDRKYPRGVGIPKKKPL